MAVMTRETSEVRVPERPWYARIGREPGTWYVLFTVYAAAVALFSGPGQDQYWGRGACAGYAVAAMLVICTRGTRAPRLGRMVALGAALAGTVVGPVAWLATHQPNLPDVTVVLRSGSLLLHHGTPYLGAAQLAHGGWLAYNPYLPVMAAFGLPKALGLPGLLGDTRPWIAIVTFGLLVAAFRVAMGREASRGTVLGLAAFLLASPVLAFPLSMGITDPPLIALACLGVALAAKRRVTAAAVVIGVACAMKETAWPAAAVLTVLVAARYGRRPAVRFALLAVATAAGLTAVLAPEALRHPGELFQNTIAYPLGLTAAKSPAQSPLPGHLLSGLGPVGHHAAIALLLASMLGIGISLLLLPPATARAAALRLALTLSLMFALCPATRFGYFAYPAALCGWLLMTVAARRPAPATTPPATPTTPVPPATPAPRTVTALPFTPALPAAPALPTATALPVRSTASPTFNGRFLPRGRKGVTFDAFSSAEHQSSVQMRDLTGAWGRDGARGRSGVRGRPGRGQKWRGQKWRGQK
jgi:hypothetical protein